MAVSKEVQEARNGLKLLNRTVDAMMAVESGGGIYDDIDDNAIGDGGKAIGPMQFHRAAIEDVNRVFGTTTKHGDELKDRGAARDAAVMYLYVNKGYLHKKLGREPTLDELVGAYNDGYKRHDSSKAKEYIAKVHAARELDKEGYTIRKLKRLGGKK